MGNVQELANELFATMQIEESVIIPGRGGWQCKITKRKDGFDFRISNPDGDWEKFFVLDSTGHPYGACMTIQETTLGIPFDKIGITGVGNPAKDRLIGELIMNKDGEIDERFSPSNFRLQSKTIELNGRQLLIDGAPKGFLNGVFEADKNRMHGHVGIFQPFKASKVKILEMENLIEKAMK